MFSFLDKFRGHHIASILSAGILPNLLLRLPGIFPCIQQNQLSVYETCTTIIKTACDSGESIRILNLLLPRFSSLFNYQTSFAEEGGQDRHHLFGNKDDWNEEFHLVDTYRSVSIQDISVPGLLSRCSHNLDTLLKSASVVSGGKKACGRLLQCLVDA